MIRFRGRIIKKRNNKNNIGPSGRLINREQFTHGDIVVHEVLESKYIELTPGMIVSLRFPNVPSDIIPSWFRNKAWAEIAGEISNKSTKKNLIIDVDSKKTFFLRSEALRALLMKGVDVLKLRESDGDSIRAQLDEALYNQDCAAVHTYLKKLGLNYGDAEEEIEIVDLFSRRAKQRQYANVSAMLESNPFLLAEQGIRRVNDVVKAVNIAKIPISPEIELYARIGSLVRQYLSEGHSYLPFHHLVYRYLQPYWKAKNIPFGEYGERTKKLLFREGIQGLPHKTQAYLTLETIKPAQDYYQVLCGMIGENSFAKGSSSGIFFNRVAFAERSAAKSLTTMIGLGKFDKEIIKTVLKQSKVNGRTSQQLKAIENALTHKVSVLAGSAGTGKTAILRDICQSLTEQQIATIILAPSASAAVNAGADIPTLYKPMTINRFVSLNSDDDWGETSGTWYGKREKDPDEPSLPIGLVVVDESSLCNIEIFAALLSDIVQRAPSAHLLLVGDPAQLPPIGPGGWFNQLVQGVVAKIPCVNLTQVFSSVGPLVKFASNIRQGTWNPLEEGIEVSEFTTGKLLGMVDSRRKESLDTMILTATVQGKLGTRELNRLLRPIFNPDGHQINETEYRINDAVVCRKNDYADPETKRTWKARKLRHPDRNTDIYNGTRGLIKDYDDATKTLFIEWQNGCGAVTTPYTIEEIPHWIESAFAITIHRAQGMRADNVIFVNDGKNLSRAMLYTAITRARKTITLLGENWETHTVKNPKPLLSFFGFRINRELEKISNLDT